MNLHKDDTIDVFINTVSTAYEHMNDVQRKKFKQSLLVFLQNSFQVDLQDKMERFLKIPSVGPLPIAIKFVGIYREIVQLYINGFFYSTIVLCSIMAERLCYDLIEESSLILENRVLGLKEKEKLFEMDWSRLINMLHEWGLILKESMRELHELRKMRNRYVHPGKIRLQNPRKDSLKALELISKIIKVEIGPSPSGRYQIKEGKLVYKKNLRK